MSSQDAPDERIIVLGLPMLIISSIMLYIFAPQTMALLGMLGMAFSGLGSAILLARRWSEEGKGKG